MLPDRVSNPGPLTYESGALPIALRGPAGTRLLIHLNIKHNFSKCLLFANEPQQHSLNKFSMLVDLVSSVTIRAVSF